MAATDELMRYLAAAVIKTGGEVRLSPDECAQAFDLTLAADDDTDGLVIKAVAK